MKIYHRITIDEFINIKSVEIYGWQVACDRSIMQLAYCKLDSWLSKYEQLVVPNAHAKLQMYIGGLNSLAPCSGGQNQCHGTQQHPILTWDGTKVAASSIYRSPACKILGKYHLRCKVSCL